MCLSKTLKFVFVFSFAFAFSINAHARPLKNIQLASDSVISQKDDSVYSVVDKMPEFPGGDKELIGFINKKLRYPADAKKKNEQGKVIVQFVISKTGKVENATVLKGMSASLDKEALRVIGKLPAWTPGEQAGNKVAVYKVVPVIFQDEESAWTVTEKTLVIIDNEKMPLGFDTQILSSGKLASAIVLKPFPKEEKAKLIDKYGRQAVNGVVLITTKKDEMEYILADTLIHTDCKEPDVLPEFPGGKAKMMTYIADSIHYPFVAQRLKTQGKVFVQFLVDNKGKISDARVIRRADYYLDKEALRVVNTMPDWTPASKCGEKLNVYVTLPISFRLEVPAAEKEWEKNDKTIVMLNGVKLPASFDLKLLNFTNLASYKVLQPTTKEVTKKLVSQYGKDAVNGVVLITTNK
ncbi:MAG TPA: energy transducer TonB [Paludibacter sp.]